MKFLRQAAHGLTRVNHFLHGAYHTTRKVLQRVDTYSSMFRRALAAAQPALQDLGVQDQTNRVAMRAVGAYETAKQALVQGNDRYAQLAAAAGN